MHGIRFADVERAYLARCERLSKEILQYVHPKTGYCRCTGEVNRLALECFPDGEPNAEFRDWSTGVPVTPEIIREKVFFWGISRWPFFDGDPVCAAEPADGGCRSLPLKEVLTGRLGCTKFSEAKGLRERSTGR